MFKEHDRNIKKAISFILFLAMVMTLFSPVLPIEPIKADTVYAAEITYIITDDRTSTQQGALEAGAKYVIEEGVTFTLTGKTVLPEGVIIEGPGTLTREKTGYFDVQGNATLSGITIDGKSVLGDAFFFRMGTKDKTLYLKDVTIENVKVSDAGIPSVAYLMAVNTTLDISGTSTITNNTGGNSAIHLANDTSKLVLRDWPTIVDNTPEDLYQDVLLTAPLSICMPKRLNILSIIGIGVIDSYPMEQPFAYEEDPDMNSRAFLYRFRNATNHEYDITETGFDKLGFIRKLAIDIDVSGSVADKIDIKDEHRRILTKPYKGGPKSVIFLEPKPSEGSVLKEMSFQDSDGNPISILPYDGEMYFWMPIDKSVSGSAVFEKKVTAFTIDIYEFPRQGESILSSLAPFITIEDINPITASVSTNETERYVVTDGDGNQVGLDILELFDFNTEYRARWNVLAENGSQFSEGATVTIRDDDGNTSQGALELESPTQGSITMVFRTAKKSIEAALAAGDFTIDVTSYSGIYDAQPHMACATATGIGETSFTYSMTYDAEGIGYTSDMAITNVTEGEETVYIRCTNDNFEGVYITESSIKIDKLDIDAEIDISGILPRPYDTTTDVSGASLIFKPTDLNKTMPIELTEDDYTAAYSFKKADVTTLPGDNQIIATNIAITNPTLQKNLNLVSSSLTGELPLGLITKDIPTYGSNPISFNPLSESARTHADLNLKPNAESEEGLFKGFRNSQNETIAVIGRVYLIDDTGVRLPPETKILKNTAYTWQFEPIYTANYECVTGSAVFWETQPITEIEIGGLLAPIAKQNPQTEESLTILAVTRGGVSVPSPASILDISYLMWFEDKGNQTAYEMPTGQKFGYNRKYKATIIFEAIDNDIFDISSSESLKVAGFPDLEIAFLGTPNKTKRHFSLFFPKTEKGTFDASEFDIIDFEDIYDGEEHTITTDPAIEGLNFTYSTSMDGEYTTDIPKFEKVGTYDVFVKATHEDYIGDCIKSGVVTINQKPIVPHLDTSLISPRPYDGSLDVTGLKITFPSVVASDDVIPSADFILENPNVEYDKYVEITNITISGIDSENYIIAGGSTTRMGIGPFIEKAMPMATGGSISYTAIKSGISLSAIDLATMGAVFVNSNNPSLTLSGIIQLTDGHNVLTPEQLDAQVVSKGAFYTYLFTPDPEYANNYVSYRGTHMLWQPTSYSGGGGGGGGGGAAAAIAPEEIPLPPIDIEEGIIIKPLDDGTVYIALVHEGKVQNDENYIATITGDELKALLEAMPEGNVLVDENGKAIVKSLITDDKILLQTKGDGKYALKEDRVLFTDTREHWAEGYIEFCALRNLLRGNGEGEFNPEDQVTRAMAAAMFYRLEQEPKFGSFREFADLDAQSWYYDAVKWTGGQGIVSGIGIQNFAPDWKVTREQLAVMIYNYAVKYLGAGSNAQGETGAEAGAEVLASDLSMYGDSENISDWARVAIAYCTANGIMQGQENTGFYPTRTATRAELAVVLERLIEKMLYEELYTE